MAILQLKLRVTLSTHFDLNSAIFVSGFSLFLVQTPPLLVVAMSGTRLAIFQTGTFDQGNLSRVIKGLSNGEDCKDGENGHYKSIKTTG